MDALNSKLTVKGLQGGIQSRQTAGGITRNLVEQACLSDLPTPAEAGFAKAGALGRRRVCRLTFAKASSFAIGFLLCVMENNVLTDETLARIITRQSKIFGDFCNKEETRHGKKHG